MKVEEEITDKDYHIFQLIEDEPTLWQKIKNWFVALVIDEYEITIYFPGNTTEKEDGTKVTEYNPKKFTCRKYKIKAENHFSLHTVDKRHVEIKTIDPVGYDIIKTK
jgi:hypothetical protein